MAHMGIAMQNRVLLLASFLAASTLQAADETLEAQVTRHVQALQGGDFAARVRAEEELRKLPAEAIPLLERAEAAPALSLDVRETLRSCLSDLRRSAQTGKTLTGLTKRATDYAKAIQQQYDEHGIHGAWDDLVREGIRQRYVPNPELLGNPASRRARAAFEKAIDAGCDDPHVKFMLLLTRIDLADADDLTDAIEPLPEQLKQRGYGPSTLAAAYLKRAEQRWQRLWRKQPQAARRASASDLAEAIGFYLAADASEFISTRERLQGCVALATLIARSDPDAVAPRLNDLLSKAAPADRDDPISVAIRLASLNAVDLALNETRKDDKAPWIDTVEPSYLEALRIACQPKYANDLDVLTTRFRVANSRNDVAVADNLCRTIVGMDPYLSNIVLMNSRLLSKNRQFAKMHELAEIIFNLPNSATHGRLEYVGIEWDIGLYEFDDPTGYLARPEVWARVSGVFETHLRAFPNDRTAHAHFAWYAHNLGKYDLAKVHFDAAGDDGDDPTRSSLSDYNYYRSKTDEALKAANP